MKGWLTRAVANTARRGVRGPRFARWSGWFPPSGPVPDERFQGADEPHPRHWRAFPAAWPAASGTGPAAEDRLRGALDRLPPRWRAVVALRDIAGRSDDEVARELGISRAEERILLARARAALRDELDAAPRPDRPS